jgi:Sigma-70, region 4
MDELTGLCTRLLGDPDAAKQAADQAREAEGRVGQLAGALAKCRALRGDSANREPAADPHADGSLAGAVAQELGAASARLPQRQQEALALRELLGLSHELLAEVLGIEPAAATALLARSRTRLHAELRGVKLEADSCPERDRMARTATLRQDGQPVSPADEDWLLDHLEHCHGCRRLHATMLEASVCYRAWPVSLSDPDPSRAVTAT